MAVVRDGVVLDLTPHTPTMAHFLNHPDPLKLLEIEDLAPLGPVGEIIANSPPDVRDPAKSYLLSPFDLQALKACGVTFVRSMLERVIEEQAKGSPDKAAALREELSKAIGAEIRNIKPGSPEAAANVARLDLRDARLKFVTEAQSSDFLAAQAGDFLSEAAAAQITNEQLAEQRSTAAAWLVRVSG